MIITTEELFVFFQEKVECAVAQIKKRGKRIAVTYKIVRRIDNYEFRDAKKSDNTWFIPPSTLSIHPLDIILDEQKVLYDKSKSAAIARRLNCDLAYIISFNEGLRGSTQPPPKYSMEHKFFMLGRRVRVEEAKKSIKPSDYFD